MFGKNKKKTYSSCFYNNREDRCRFLKSNTASDLFKGYARQDLAFWEMERK